MAKRWKYDVDARASARQPKEIEVGVSGGGGGLAISLIDLQTRCREVVLCWKRRKAKMKWRKEDRVITETHSSMASAYLILEPGALRLRATPLGVW